MKGWALVGLLSVMSVAHAEEDLPTPADLPATALARAWLEQDATVQQAISELSAARHAAGMLDVSPHEWTLKLSSQRRNYRSTDTDSNEWTTQLERTLRIPGKGSLDRQIGELGVEIAEAELGEAVHEAARSLLDLWMSWLEAVQLKTLLAEQLEFSQSNLRAVEVRERTGDAARFEVNVAASDVAELQRKLAEATGNVVKARARLKLRFPAAPDTPPELAVLEKVSIPEAAWRERILAMADPLIMAELEVERAQRVADRARADRIPDPTIGVYTGSEALRNERVVGLSTTVPLPGRYRREQAGRSSDGVAAAIAARNRQLQIIEVEIAEVYADAMSSYESWRLAEQGAAKTRENAQLTQRAYALGEADLQTLLLARQQSLTTAQAMLATRVAALRAHHKLLIDAHRIWGLSHE